MEITGAGRLEVRITPLDVGKRVSIRRLVDPSEGPGTFTDVVGVLTSWDEGGVLVLTRRSGEVVRVPETSLVAGKTVPAAPARRRGPAADFAELTRVASRAWQPVESERLGEWELRAASGFTRRANSALAVGDPGVPLDEALDRVRSWYAERSLPAYVQAATGAAGTQETLCAALEERGWTREVSADVRIGALAPVADLAPGRDPVALARSVGGPDGGWLRRYQRASGDPAPHMLRVLESGPSVWFASVAAEPAEGGGDGGDTPVAIGRCVVDGRWAGFMAVEVDPAHRRRGLARAVMTALARRALEEGASAAWLQVETDNTAAGALYAGLGFTTHHSYHHYRAPRD
ncbi:GNAT family N-acetyltransferase [Streptomyces qinzhouensis]|uniref:GNAT family N-acetyltransferase n=1 Tax=Streptomyces qinzhouensis TaxID=2599401 RepID=A0A5B8JM76_9ACTN|nr:GNAT family N-acetyltransferase [Streptomyces qinzhouensis]QDY78870.1 GNAT family N-acetyltransferase [Streptomyces qinzhouensis]